MLSYKDTFSSTSSGKQTLVLFKVYDAKNIWDTFEQWSPLDCSFGWSCCDKCFSELICNLRNKRKYKFTKSLDPRSMWQNIHQVYAHRCGWVAITSIPWTRGHPHPKHCTGLCALHTQDSSSPRAECTIAGTSKSQWCQCLEVWKNLSYLLTELLSPLFSYSFLFHKFCKLLPRLKCDPENPPSRIKGEKKWKTKEKPTFHLKYIKHLIKESSLGE